MEKLTVLFIVFGILVVLTNIITQLLKKLVNRDKFPTQVLCLVISEVLSIASFIAYCQIYNISIYWYMIFGVVVVGLVVCYCSVFGYDNLLQEIKKMLESLKKGDDLIEQ